MAAGKNSAAVAQSLLLPPLGMCFSLVFADRTVDLAANSASEFHQWISTLRPLIAQPAIVERPRVLLLKADESLHTPSAPAPGRSGNGGSHRNVGGEETKGRAGTSQTLPHPVFAGGAPLEQSEAPPPARKVATVEQVMYWRSTIFNHARHNRFEEIRTALDDGCPIDLVESGEPRDSILLVACRLGWTRIAELCLERGANFDPHPDFGLNALQLVHHMSPCGAEQLIFDHRSVNGDGDVDLRVLMILFFLSSYLQAVENDHLPCAKLLLEEAAASDAAQEISNLVVEDGTQVCAGVISSCHAIVCFR